VIKTFAGQTDQISRIGSAGRNFVTIQINHRYVRALVDTGASISCLSKLSEIPIFLEHPNSITLVSANNTPMPTMGQVELTVFTQGLSVPCTFTVFNDLSHDCILGVDWLTQNHATIDCGKQIVALYDGLVVLKLQRGDERQRLLYIKRSMTIPPQCEAIVPVCFRRGNTPPLAVIEAWPPIKDRMLGVAPAFVKTHGDDTVCRIINLGVTPRKLRAHTPIAQVMRINMLEPFNFAALTGKGNGRRQTIGATSAVTLPDHADRLTALKEIGLTFEDTKLPETDFGKLTALLYSNIDLFATSLEQLPGSTLPGHDIRLTDETPFRVKQFRQPPHLQDQIRKQCEELLRAKIIERSDSAFNSPAFLVRKGGGSPQNPQYRFIVDMRTLNKRIAPQFFPLPSVEDAINQIGQEPRSLYSLIDQKSGYFQLFINEPSRKFTEFSAGGEHFHFTRAVMGCKNSGFHYMSSLSRLLAQELTDSALLYLDDLITYSSDLESHLKLLSGIFDKFRLSQLRMNPEKSKFACESLVFLGFRFDLTGVRVDEKRFAGIANMPRPRSAKQVKVVLGMFSYLRRFIKNFSIISAPLRKLLANNEPFEWTNEQQQAFDTLKERVLANTTLVYPRNDREYTIYVDGSKDGYGYALCQKDDEGVERFISFNSRFSRSN